MNEIATAILEKNKYGVLSTVREDGSPWATPVHIAYKGSNLYWFSNEDTVHSINIARNNKVFITIFDSAQKSKEPGEHGALYISTQATQLRGQVADEARAVFNEKYPAKSVEDRLYFKCSEDSPS